MSEDDPAAGARIEALERELAWQAANGQRLEGQLTAALDRAYQIETVNARLWAALGMLAATRGEETGVVAPDLPAPAWPRVADELARLLQTLAQDGVFPFPPAGAAPAGDGMAAPPLTPLNVELRDLAEAPPLARPPGRALLSDAVSMIPSADRALHAASTGSADFSAVEGASRTSVRLLCRSRDVRFVRVTIKPDRVRPPSHLMIETKGWRAAQQMKTPHVRIGLAGAETRDGWTRLSLLVEATGVEHAPIQIALSDVPSAFLADFAGREGQALDIAWIVAAPAGEDAADG